MPGFDQITARLIRTIAAASVLGCLALPAAANDLVPTGTLRATFLANNPVQAVTDAKSGEVSGPAADLTRELARRLPVPFPIKGHPRLHPAIAPAQAAAPHLTPPPFTPL